MDQDAFEEMHRLWNKMYIYDIHKKPRMAIDTDVMIELIQRYGPNHIYNATNNEEDNKGMRLVHDCSFMTREQIDILFSHKLEYIDNRNSTENEKIAYSFYMFDKDGAYVLQKFLDQNPSISFLHEKIKLLDNKLEKFIVFKMIDLKNTAGVLTYYSKEKREFERLIHNHIKRYQTLFELLLPLIEDNNKKLCVY